MTSVRRLFSVVVAAVLVFLPSCHRNTTTAQQGPQYIMLTWNNGTCQQNGSEMAEVSASGSNVIYQGAAALTQFQIQLSSCPFASGNCPVNSPNGNSVNVGPPNSSAAGNTYMYSSMTINNQQCTNGGALGLRVKPGP